MTDQNSGVFIVAIYIHHIFVKDCITAMQSETLSIVILFAQRVDSVWLRSSSLRRRP